MQQSMSTAEMVNINIFFIGVSPLSINVYGEQTDLSDVAFALTLSGIIYGHHITADKVV
jgi:hypothetical protein